MTELVFEAVQEADGGYGAECLTENIVTQGETWDNLRQNALETVAACFFDGAAHCGRVVPSLSR